MSGLKAIYVVGPSSTGKTTLCDALVVARTVMKEQGFTRADVDSLAMQHAIVKAQASRDRETRDQKAWAEDGVGTHSTLLSDRSAVDAVVYAALSELVVKSGNTQTLISSPEFQAILPFYRSPKSKFVLLRPIQAWIVDDGVRSLKDGEHYYDMFIELGEDCRWLEERIAIVTRAIYI
ncbi:hypothetical protein J3R30DRAFT_3661779 [Lentinula aciculospora]|uniref:NadR/Ttd14 AAA domain-containing protein n=1 Tax=Lentinula aciculospora TaxID=153920 RepID=A0A9W8ZXR6_9AGAR|nr:hypothetical protein J3R30DRAFT_3661779 [Lentinula aciculospora]